MIEDTETNEEFLAGHEEFATAGRDKATVGRGELPAAHAQFLAEHSADVAEALRAAAAAEIMPRFRKLAAHEVDQKKGPHDLVTDADRLAERYLTETLGALLPGSVVVGEEAVHADPYTYEAIGGDAPVWIVDPVDGTRQFVHGDPGFCTLVALAHHGVVLASWTYAPALGQLATAVRGQGAFLDGERLHAGSPAPGRDLQVATSHPDYTTDDQKRSLLGLWTDGVAPRHCGSAGLEYLAIARGESDATAFSWEKACETHHSRRGVTSKYVQGRVDQEVA